jgi:predicted nucleic-acid-binding Zn-ribbon protein
MEKKKLSETDEELTCGGQIVIYDDGTRRTMRMICPKCFSRNLEFVKNRIDIDDNIAKEGTFDLTAKNAVNFYGRNDDRYRITCRDCGYTDYAKTFKNEYVVKGF